MPETILRTYTLDEAVTAVLDGVQRNKFNGSSQDVGNDGWAGCSWSKSVDLVTNGWEKGVPKLDTVAHTRVAESLRPQQVWDVSGSECDVASFLAGVPECMGEVVRRRRPSPVVRIGVDRAASASVSREKIEELGRNVLLLVESLRLSGTAAELWACQTVSGLDGKMFDLRVRIQEAGRPIDVSRLAYWLAHPAALRRTMFALEELESDQVRQDFGFQVGRYYGSPNPGFAKKDFDEWAPGANEAHETVLKWVEDVMTRRTR